MRAWLLIVLMALPGQCAAWGSKGHSVVASIAWHYLTPQARAQVSLLLDAHGFDSIAEIANWPDHIRDQDAFKHTGRWHYVNLPRNAKHYQQQRDCPRYCVVTALEKMRQQLMNGTSIKKRAEALAFVIHFVGDIHQPLHVSYADDRGGNTVEVMVNQQKVNLHYYWDSLLLTQDPDWPALTTQLIAEFGSQQKVAWRQDEVSAWVDESLTLTRHIYSQLTDKVDKAMLQQNREQAHQRLFRAGMRLAYQLNQIFK